ncbi:MAG: hypothetical protein HEQ32_05630 [Vampirovibrio sp.]
MTIRPPYTGLTYTVLHNPKQGSPAKPLLDDLIRNHQKTELAEKEAREAFVKTFNQKIFVLRNMTSSNSRRTRGQLVQELREMLNSHNLNNFKLPQASIDEFYELIGKEVKKNLNHVIKTYV